MVKVCRGAEEAEEAEEAEGDKGKTPIILFQFPKRKGIDGTSEDDWRKAKEYLENVSSTKLENSRR